MSTVSEHWDAKYRQNVVSAWTANAVVFKETCRRMTGGDSFWLNWLFESYLTEQPKRLLSIGCGNGAHELIIARNRWVDYIEAFDASPEGIATASAVASREGLNAKFTVSTFEEFASSTSRESFDMVMFCGSLHHVYDLEAMLRRVRDILTPSGVLVFNEYVGACYNIYGAKQVAIINSFLRAIPPEMKVRPDAQWINPTLEASLAADPSESVRSALILPLLDVFFRPAMRRFFGGALLHPIFDLLDGERINDGSTASVGIVSMLIEAENHLTEAGVLPHDFCFGVCFQKAQHV